MKTAYIGFFLVVVFGIILPSVFLVSVGGNLLKKRRVECRFIVKGLGILAALICIVFSVELSIANPALMFRGDVSVAVEKISSGKDGRVQIKGTITNISSHAVGIVRAGNDVELFELNDSGEPKEIYPLKFISIFSGELKPSEHYPFNASFPATLFQNKHTRFVVGAPSVQEFAPDPNCFSKPFTVPQAFLSRTQILAAGVLLCLTYIGLYWRSLLLKA